MENYTRIRYDKKSNGTVEFLQARQAAFVHPTNGARYAVYLHTSETPLRYELVDVVAQLTAHEGTSNTLNGVKKAAKAKLVELGIPFEPETRSKRVEASNDESGLVAVIDNGVSYEEVVAGTVTLGEKNE